MQEHSISLVPRGSEGILCPGAAGAPWTVCLGGWLGAWLGSVKQLFAKWAYTQEQKDAATHGNQADTSPELTPPDSESEAFLSMVVTTPCTNSDYSPLPCKVGIVIPLYK